MLFQKYKKYFQEKFEIKPFESISSSLNGCFETEFGKGLLNKEQEYLDSLLSDIFGYHLMQLSILNQPLYLQSPTSHQFHVYPLKGKIESEKVVVSPFEQLPIATESIDVALLHHVLDYSENPHMILREATRTLIPNGYLILVGFNPFSVMGLGNIVGCLFSTRSCWRYQRLRVGRLKDWFQVLGLELVHSQKAYYGWPWSSKYSEHINNWSQKLMPGLGCFYVLVARKSVVPMTMIKQKWRKKSAPAWRKATVVSSAPHKK